MRLQFFAKVLFVGISAVAMFSTCRSDKGINPDLLVKCDTITYSKNIAPIITSSCAFPDCHNAGSPNGDYSTYDGLKAKAANGTLRNRVLVVADMPKVGTLTLIQRQMIKCWIESGAPNN